METDRHSDIWTVDPRVEVFRDDQTLLPKPQDITVPRLARVFKVKDVSFTKIASPLS